MDERCHICGSIDLLLLSGVSEFVPVSSDIRLVEGRLTLAYCRACGVLQKLTDITWSDAVARVYRDYTINHQGAGCDPYIYTSLLGPGPRASLLMGYLSETLVLPPGGRLLDIGCANGNILRAFSAIHPDWALFGMENSPRWKDTVLAIPGVQAFFSDWAGLAQARFDLIVMSHVLEHIPQPALFLAKLCEHLTEGGHLFIAVPDIRQNPIDMLVLDHCTHFDVPTLDLVLTRGGFIPSVLSGDVLGKELVALCRPGIPVRGNPSNFTMSLDAVAQKYVALCRDLAIHSRELRARHSVFGIMGTSTAAAWAAGELAMAVDFFVDEDVQRIGGTAFGKPVLSLANVPTGACVFIPMSCTTAQAIISRANREDVTFAYLPWNQTEDVRQKASKVYEISS